MNQIVLIALRRPYTFVVMSILIILFGAKSILHMPTDVFPNITVPVISVVWPYTGLLPIRWKDVSPICFERVSDLDGGRHPVYPSANPTTASASSIFFFSTKSTSAGPKPNRGDCAERS